MLAWNRRDSADTSSQRWPLVLYPAVLKSCDSKPGHEDLVRGVLKLRKPEKPTTAVGIALGAPQATKPFVMQALATQQ